MKVIYGIANKDKGKIFIMGKEVEIRNPRDAIRNGIGMVPPFINPHPPCLYVGEYLSS